MCFLTHRLLNPTSNGDSHALLSQLSSLIHSGDFRKRTYCKKNIPLSILYFNFGYSGHWLFFSHWQYKISLKFLIKWIMEELIPSWLRGLTTAKSHVCYVASTKPHFRWRFTCIAITILYRKGTQVTFGFWEHSLQKKIFHR